MAWGSIPWPDDLYLEDGHVAVTSLPFESSDTKEVLERAIATIDGAGTRPTIVFAFDGELDPASLPASPADSLAPESSVFLIDADASSPDAFERLPLEVGLSPDRRSIHARVAHDRALAPARRYAAVVTDALRARSGNRRVAAAERFERILDNATPAVVASELRARAQYWPILPALEAEGITRSRVVALASFRVQSVERDLNDARTSLSGETLAPPVIGRALADGELDDVLGDAPDNAVGAVLGEGVAHQHIATLVHLLVTTPRFANVDEGARRVSRAKAACWWRALGTTCRAA